MTDPTQTASSPETLEFDTDRGSSRSVWIASGILLALILWMGSGFILPSDAEAPPAEAAQAQVPSVIAQSSTAESVTLTFRAEGQAQADRDTALRAEATGDVTEVLVTKGDDVDAGAVIARLSGTRAQADLTRAEEERTRAQREIDNAQELLDRGVGTADRVSEARAALASAEAAVVTARETLDDLNILAPFAGRIEALTLDEGEFISAGEEIGRIVDNRPLTVAIQVPQQALTRIEVGQTAEVSFITGETREGVVTFVGSSASSETRTFLAEIEIPNEDGAIPAGISAEALIPTGEAQAHFISPSVVSLGPDGALGVKTVKDDTVAFNPVEIVRAELQGVWVQGLPDQAEIITIGQGFVQAGERVRAQPPEQTDADLASATDEAAQ